MGKKKNKTKKPIAQSWCWYCDRTFEDDKVLLQHQKSKHFRCPHCPRRLNTAGGLRVHIDQVHKLGPPDRIDNALPGRDSLDIEIYGMEGIPAADLAAWKQKQAEEFGVPEEQQRSKRPKYDHRPLTASEIRAQLAQHKALMSGQPLGPPPGQFAPPPNGQPMMPPGFFNGPPMGGPGFGGPPPPPPHFSGPPGMPNIPPPGFIPPPMGMPFPPPGFPGFPAGLPPPPPGFVPPPGLGGGPLGAGLPSFLPPPPGAPGPGGASPYANSPAPPAAAAAPKPKERLPSSAVELKPGTMLVYGDNDESIEEKRARLSQYRVELGQAEKEIGGVTAAVNEASKAIAGESRKRERAADMM